MPPDGLRMDAEIVASVRPEGDLDRVGRKQPRRFTVFTALRACSELYAAFRDIPGEYWAVDVNSRGFSEAQVSCPCGETPEIELGTVAECQCERHYMFIAGKVMVANSPKDREQAA